MLSVLSIYMSYSKDQINPKNDEPILNSSSPLISQANWFYLFTSALFVDEFYPLQEESSQMSRLIQSIKSEFKNMLYANANKGCFFPNFFEYLCTETVKSLGDENQFGVLQLNHLSFFFTRFVDLAMERFVESVSFLDALNTFAQYLISHFISLK